MGVTLIATSLGLAGSSRMKINYCIFFSTFLIAPGAFAFSYNIGAYWQMSTTAQEAYIKPSNNNGVMNQQANFGWSVAVSGDTAVVGAPFEDVTSTGINPSQTTNPVVTGSSNGAVYVFTRSGTTWTQQAYIKSPRNISSQFGIAVDLSTDSLIVGANIESSSTTGINSVADSLASQSGAAFVFTRSGTTWSQQAYIKASNTGVTDQFGAKVTISGDTAAVTAPLEDSNATGVGGSEADNTSLSAGAVYVFTRSGTTWTQQAYIKPSNTDAEDQFGLSLELSTDTLAVGSAYEDSNATGIGGTESDNTAVNSGAVYVFARSAGVWTQQAYIKASNTDANDQFGYDLALSADTLVVGAYSEDSNATGIGGNQTSNSSGNSGAVYVFTRSGSTWSQQAYIKASNTGASDYFGISVAIDVDTLAVGARQEDSNASGIGGSQSDNSLTDSGATYIFTRSAGVWTQQAYIKAATPQIFSYFGNCVAINSDTLIVGAMYESSSATGVDGSVDSLAPMSGAAFVFTRSGATWTQQAYLKQSTNLLSNIGSVFGVSMSLHGSTLVVGRPFDDASTVGVNPIEGSTDAVDSGAVYVFTRSGTTWSQQAYIKASNPSAGDNFGYSVSLHSDTLAVGSQFEDSTATTIGGAQNDSGFNVGAAYVFTRSAGVWTQQAYIKAANSGHSDQFGASVSASVDSLAVGTRLEDSSSTGVNGAINDLVQDAGAAYVFTRSAGVWTQQAFIKASNTDAFDYFGTSLSLDIDTLAVSAYAEDSNATGVGGNQSNNSALNSGAVYVFTRSGTTWSQQAYIKASNTEANDQFSVPLLFNNNSIQVQGDNLVVSAVLEDSNARGLNGNQADNSAVSSGAVYVFTRTAGVWSQEAYIKSINSEANDACRNVSIDGTKLAIGCTGEDSHAYGVQGNQWNNSRGDSGAVFIFDKASGTWTFKSYLKSSRGDTSDQLGSAVALSGNLLAAGAYLEDSNATGINGDQTNNTNYQGGAVYIFNLAVQ